MVAQIAQNAQNVTAEPTLPTAWRVATVLTLAFATGAMLVGPVGGVQPDSRIYVQASESLTEGSYHAAVERSGLPRYPPGLPIMLVPFLTIWGEPGARAAGLLFAVALLVLLWSLAWRLAGPRAAAVLCALWMLSPMLRNSGVFLMSDPAAAAFVVLALLAVAERRWLLAGLALGWSSWVRLPHALFLAATRRRGALLGGLALLVPLAIFQLKVYGRLASYDGGQAQFSASYVTGGAVWRRMTNPSPWPNWQYFPGILLGWQGQLVPLLPPVAGWEMWRRRREHVAQAAAAIALLNLAMYLPYFFQVTRFVLPAACILVLFSAVAVERLAGSVPPHRPADRVLAAAPLRDESLQRAR